MSVIEISKPEWTNDDLRAQFDVFEKVYANRPISDNAGGMKAPHAFGAWLMIKMIQPQTIIDCGYGGDKASGFLSKHVPVLTSSVLISISKVSNIDHRKPDAFRKASLLWILAISKKTLRFAF